MAGGGQGDDVKTTGGLEHSLADPAIEQESAEDPVAMRRAAGFDGDDIVVEPGAPHLRSRRVQLAAGAAVAAVLLVAGITAAVVTRDHMPTRASALRSVAPPHPPHPRPSAPAVAAKPEPKPTRALRPHAPTPLNKTTTVNVGPPASPAAHATTPSVGTPPSPVTAVPVEPTSVLVWSATPSKLSVRGGAQTRVAVIVVNPTNGTVTLGTPLSCAPTLRGPRGAVIGGPMCEQITQTLAPHAKLTQHYTLFATDNGSASGSALRPGTYTATVENQFKMTVNVSAT